MTERGRGDVMSYQVTALPNMQFVRSLSGRSGTALILIKALRSSAGRARKESAVSASTARATVVVGICGG